MWIYRSLLAFDALVFLILLYFFFDSLQYASPDDMLIWLPILGVPAAMITGALLLRDQRKGVAVALLALLAVPPALFALLFGALIIANPSWH